MTKTPPYPVWVDSSLRWGQSSRPGILLAWRRGPGTGASSARHGAWQACVVFADRQGHGDVIVTQMWLDAHMIRPVSEGPPTADLSRYRPVGSY